MTQYHGSWLPGLATAALLWGAIAPASAAIVQYSFTGHITNGPGDFVDPNNFFNGLVAPGTAVSGSMTYDTAGAVDGTPADPTRANYPGVVTQSAINFGAGFLFNQHLAASHTPDGLETNDIQLLAGPGQLNGFFNYGALVAPQPYIFAELGVILSDSTQGALPTDAIPATAPNFAAFDSRTFQFVMYVADTSIPNQFGSPEVEVFGVIDTLTEVPEPSSALLLGGLGVLLAGRRRARA